MGWVRGIVSGRVGDDRRITAVTRDLEVVSTPKPARFEDSGSDQEMFNRLRNRTPGDFETMAHFGGAVAVLVPFCALTLLPEPLMQKLRQKYNRDKHTHWSKLAFMAPVRTTSGGGRWNDAEPCGGMFEGLNFDFEALEEVCELGVYREDGWLGFVLPDELQKFQINLIQRQEFWWSVVRPGFPRGHQAPIRFLPSGQDDFNGSPGIITAGPVGDFSVTRIAHLSLPGTGWRFLDTESRPGNPEKGEPEWVPLNRKVVAIVDRTVRAPLVLELHPEGHLHPGGHHFVLDGENVELAVTHIGKAVLQSLGWLK